MSRKVRAFATAAVFTMVAGSAQATLLWDGNASKGTGVFKLIGSNCSSPGSVTAGSDATYGTVWRYNKPSGLDRCESHGARNGGSNMTFGNNSTYYLGWRYRLSSTIDNNAQFQWKVFPAPGPAGLNWPLALKVVNNRAVMLNRKGINSDGSYEVYEIWSHPITANTWYEMVLNLRLSSARDGGYIEIWRNGVQQTLLGGTTRWACRLYDTDHVCPKWGVYGASGGSVVNTVHGLKIGTTFGDVNPGGPTPPTPTATPTPTPTPTSTSPVPTSTPTPTPTPTGPSEFIEITPPGSAVTASTSDTNVGSNVVDNNLGTRWSGNGDGAWVRLDLGSDRVISHVRVGVYQGNVRRNRFEIQLSSDASAWTSVFNGESSGSTTGEETYDFPTATARYVRYLGHGNIGSTNTSMNSVTEISVYTFNMPPTATPTPTATPVPTVTPTPPVGPVELTPGGAAVSASTNDGNVPANTVDDSLSTRWSANGDGQWIQYDLGSTRTVSSVSVAWYQGNTRVSTFDVLASDSATGPWTTLAAGRQSNGTSTALQSHDVPDGSGRYVRIVGHGNTVNVWNSITEVQIWGQ
jgi:hypothetical protein